MSDTAQDKVILAAQDVSYCYEGEDLPVWKGLSLSFYEGEIHAICGPSGCGKSSLLYLLDGLIPHMYEGDLEGSVYMEGEDVTDIEPRDRCETIGFVMQNPESQFCTFTVEDELAFGMENIGLPRDEMELRIRETLDYVGMAGFEETNLDQLSGGQKQKVAIASLLVMRPKILLLDEPTANLDPASREQIFQLIVRMSRESHITVIVVEHNIDDIRDEVDRFIIMDRNGRIAFDGPGRDVPAALSTPPTYPDALPLKERDLSTKEEVLHIEGLKFAYPVAGKKRKRRRRKKAEQPHYVLDGLDLVVRRQEFLAIVGENGAGKTTLTRLVFRIEKPDAGRIELLGKPIESYRKNDLYHLIGLVFQNPENQFITNTVDEEMMFSLKRSDMDEDEKRQRVDAMLEQFHLEDYKEKSPFVLSQGQERRLSVATMLLTNQQILFLDEPTYGQDYENRQELMRDMQALIKKGITIIMITHDLELVRHYATRVVEIEGGRVVRDADTDSYFAQREAGRGR